MHSRTRTPRLRRGLSKLFSKDSIFMSVFECFSVDDGKNASKDIGVEEA